MQNMTISRVDSENTIKQRINRKLANDGQRLFKYRSGTFKDWYYVVDIYRNVLVWDKIGDLEAYARDIGVMPGA